MVSIHTDPLTTNPREWGLGHDNWRAGQAASLAAAIQPGVNFIEAPTGSGKTALACGAGELDRVVAMCRTKVLQQENYAGEYDFTPIYGKGNYPCRHPDAEPYATCTDCLFTKRGKNSGMGACDYARECEYLIAKARFFRAQRATCNYAYWMSSPGIRKKPPQYLFLDECHQLTNLVLEWVGITITQEDRYKWGFPPFPKARLNKAISLAGAVRVEGVINNWIDNASRALELRMSELQNSEVYRRESPENVKLAREAERLLVKLETVQEALLYGDDWFIESGPGTVQRGGKFSSGLVARPLTPKAHFGRFFSTDPERTLTLMSATIGRMDVLASQLGISEFSSHVVPPRFGPERQPVYDIGAPKMGRAAKPSAYLEQARLIAKAIHSAPKTWSGIIHVTRWKETKLLADRLAKHGLGDRVWTPTPGWSTNYQVKMWDQRRRRVPGSLIITPSFFEGYNGLDEEMCFIAKCPFPYLGSRYNRARKDADGKQYLQETAWDLEQATGRTRRGREIDYDTPERKAGLVVIADGSARARGVFKYLSQAKQDSIVKWDL
jgi:Rad3-related DNA helicase